MSRHQDELPWPEPTNGNDMVVAKAEHTVVHLRRKGIRGRAVR